MTATVDTAVAELAEEIFSRTASPAVGFDADLWSTCEDAGLARLTLPEAAGGSGGTLVDAAVVLAAAGAHAARVPLVETDLLAGRLLLGAGIALPPGPLTAVAAPPPAAGGSLLRVPWARAAAGIAVLAGDRVLLLDPGAVTVTAGANLAEEPRDTVTVTAGGLDDAAVAAAPAPAGAAEELRLHAALGRALLLAGAVAGALERSVRYAGEREQFGRPIARFQAVQQQLALAAAEVAAAQAAASSAARAAAELGVSAAWFPIAAAKARTSEAAGAVARIAHQVHGALGFTREHDLRLLTTRLWAWRDEDGSEAHWNTEVGTAVLAAGPEALWEAVTGTP